MESGDQLHLHSCCDHVQQSRSNVRVVLKLLGHWWSAPWNENAPKYNSRTISETTTVFVRLLCVSVSLSFELIIHQVSDHWPHRHTRSGACVRHHFDWLIDWVSDAARAQAPRKMKFAYVTVCLVVKWENSISGIAMCRVGNRNCWNWWYV